jgi:uncharacterized ParB-like nuclease family protein
MVIELLNLKNKEILMDRYLEMEAEEAYKKFKNSKGILGFSLGKQTQLKKFDDIQKEANAYSNSFLGLQNVEMDKIIGSVGKVEDFDKNFIPKNKILKFRWCSIYKEMIKTGNLPPVQLYKVKDEYFAYDGNHRISVAKYLNLKYIEAEVTEFFPSTEDPKDIIYWEKFYFFKQTDIKDIETDKAGVYEIFLRKIQVFEKNQRKLSDEKLSFQEVAKLWYKEIFLPIKEILEINRINEDTRNEKFGDIFIDFIDFKDFIEENGTKNYGYCYSLIHFLYKNNKNTQMYLDDYLIKLFLKLYKFDVEISLSKERVEKLKILRECFETSISSEIKIIKKIDKYFKRNQLQETEENIRNWIGENSGSYIAIINEILKRNIDFYKENPSIFYDKGKLFIEAFSYKKIFEKIYKKSLTDLEIALLYILEIAQPISDVLSKSSIPREEILNLYYLLSKRYSHYLMHGSNITFDLLYKAFDKNEKVNFQEKLKTLVYGKNFKTPEFFIDLKKDLNENQTNQLNSILEKFNMTVNYKTELALKKFKDEYEEISKEDWLSKLENDLTKLSENEELKTYYNTSVFFEFLRDSAYPYTIIDFYSTILNSFEYLGTNRQALDIITLGTEYIYEHEFLKINNF